MGWKLKWNRKTNKRVNGNVWRNYTYTNKAGKWYEENKNKLWKSRKEVGEKKRDEDKYKFSNKLVRKNNETMESVKIIEFQREGK